MTEPLLRVEKLRLGFRDDLGRLVPVLQDVDLKIEPGEAVALTGPSGCGKSLLARAICGLLPPSAQIMGSIFWRGRELTLNNGRNWQPLRGGSMTLILQEPATSLNPVMRVGPQIAESWALHHPGRQSGLYPNLPPQQLSLPDHQIFVQVIHSSQNPTCL